MLLGYDEEGGFPEAGNISLISLFSLGTVRICILLILLLLCNRGRIKSKALSESFYKKKKTLKCEACVISDLLCKAGLNFFVPLYLGYDAVICLHKTIGVSCGKSCDV